MAGPDPAFGGLRGLDRKADIDGQAGLVNAGPQGVRGKGVLRSDMGMLAMPNLTPITAGDFRRKVVYAKPGRRQQLMKIPKESNHPWPGRPFAISVRIYAADTLRPTRSTVWYKEPMGFNTDLRTHRKGHPDHRHHWWVDRLPRVDIGSLRLRAWKSRTAGRVFVVEYQPGDIRVTWPDPRSRRLVRE